MKGVLAQKVWLNLGKNMGCRDRIKSPESERCPRCAVRCGEGNYREVRSITSWQLDGGNSIELVQFIGTATGPNFNIDNFGGFHNVYRIGISV